MEHQGRIELSVESMSLTAAKRLFLDLPAEERHRRLLQHHETQQHAHLRQESSLASEDFGFFSSEEKKQIHQAHKFLRMDGEDVDGLDDWATRVAKKYYGRLFKEYCIVDLSLYEYGCLGTRWRTEEEVLNGKGQFICASKQCEDTKLLHTYEVNFMYSEDGIKKQALVKVRLCPLCMKKMNYRRTVLKEKVAKVLHRRSKRKREGLSSKTAKKSKTGETKTDLHSKEHPFYEDSEAIDDCIEDLLL